MSATTLKSTGLIIGGKVVPCDLPVSNWHDHGMEFKVGDGGRKRIPKQLIDLFVWHWTGGQGTMEQLYAVLEQRDLGVEFGIDRSGSIFQFADPLLIDTYDAGPYNPRSVGCEITNYGFFMDPNQKPSAKDADRGTYITTQNGKQRKFAKFYDWQVQSAMALGRAVSAAIPTIPYRVPATPEGALYENTMTRAQLQTFAGHLGHFHLTDGKSDPGKDLLSAFIASGRFQPTTP